MLTLTELETCFIISIRLLFFHIFSVKLAQFLPIYTIEIHKEYSKLTSSSMLDLRKTNLYLQILWNHWIIYIEWLYKATLHIWNYSSAWPNGKEVQVSKLAGKYLGSLYGVQVFCERVEFGLVQLIRLYQCEEKILWWFTNSTKTRTLFLFFGK